jgi:hypothetical protein
MAFENIEQLLFAILCQKYDYQDDTVKINYIVPFFNEEGQAYRLHYKVDDLYPEEEVLSLSDVLVYLANITCK